MEQLRIKVAGIEFALGALILKERKIVELKFFERYRDVIIYEMKLLMAPATFYKTLNSAMKTMREILSEEKLKSF